MMLPVPTSGASKRECFLCTAPKPPQAHWHEEFCTAYLVGLIDGVRAMREGRDKRLCMEHETRFRELLVVYVDDPTVAVRLGILAR